MAKPDATRDVGSHFAWLRTRLSIERTLTSWVRTATALIGFGFTIFQFFEHLNKMSGVGHALDVNTYRFVALGLVGAGTLALFVAIQEYRDALRYLWRDEFRTPSAMRAARASCTISVAGQYRCGRRRPLRHGRIEGAP